MYWSSKYCESFFCCYWKRTVAGTRATGLGYRSSSGSQTDSCVYGHDNVSSGTSADIFGVNRTNSQTNTLLLDNGSYTNIRSNVGCTLGTALLPFNNIYSDSQLIGTVNSRLVNDIVSNTSIGTLNNLCSFVSDKIKLLKIPQFQHLKSLLMHLILLLIQLI